MLSPLRGRQSRADMWPRTRALFHGPAHITQVLLENHAGNFTRHRGRGLAAIGAKHPLGNSPEKTVPRGRNSGYVPRVGHPVEEPGRGPRPLDKFNMSSKVGTVNRRSFTLTKHSLGAPVGTQVGTKWARSGIFAVGTLCPFPENHCCD